MKTTSAIIRLFCWSLAALILTGIFLGALVFDLFSWEGFPKLNIGWYREEKMSGEYTVQHTYTLDQKATRLDLDWQFGSVVVVLDDTVDSIRLEELAQRPLDEDEKLQYTLDGDQLKVRYASKRGFVWFKAIASKKLKISLPTSLRHLAALKVNTRSAGIDTRGLTIDTVDLHTVSGEITVNITAKNWTMDTVSGRITECSGAAESLKLNTVSGDISLLGQFDDIQWDSVSGDLSIRADAVPNRLKADAVSGSVILEIPDNDGFTLDYDTVSGSLNCDFPVTEKNSKKVYGNGSATLDVNTVSGDITIRKIPKQVTEETYSITPY